MMLPSLFLTSFKHGFQPFLKFAAEFRARNQRAHIQREQLAVLQAVGHVAAHDALRKSFGNRGFAHAGLADQHGIVLRFARKNADNVSDFACLGR